MKLKIFFALYLSIPARVRNLTKILKRAKKSLHLYNRVRKKKFNEIIKKVENVKLGYSFYDSFEIGNVK